MMRLYFTEINLRSMRFKNKGSMRFVVERNYSSKIEFFQKIDLSKNYFSSFTVISQSELVRFSLTKEPGVRISLKKRFLLSK